MKRFAAVLLCLALVFALCACSGEPQEKPTKEVKSYSDVYDAICACREENDIYGDAKFFRNDVIATDAAEAEAAGSYKGTNVQVEGIDEGDIVKTDGKYIYAIMAGELRIYIADGANTALVSTVAMDAESFWPQEMYLCGDKLLVIGCKNEVFNGCCDVEYYCAPPEVKIFSYDVSNPNEPSYVNCFGQDGYYTGSRLYDGKLYVVSDYCVAGEIDEDEPETYIPRTYCGGETELVPADCICVDEGMSNACYTVSTKYDVESGSAEANLSLLSNSGTLYMSENALYVAYSEYYEECVKEYEEDGYTVRDMVSGNKTTVYRIGLPSMNAVSSVTVPGLLESQFSMDEYGGNLRLVTTADTDSYSSYCDEKHGFENIEWNDEESLSSTGLYVFDGELNRLAAVEGLAENEYVRSVRFDGDFVYFCTFRQVDPLFAVNVSDPENPEILSELKISGFSEYLHPWSDGLLFGLGMEADENTGGTEGMKLVMFDVSDKADVKAKHTLNLDCNYSEAMYDHHALLISPEKGIIGFGADDSFEFFSYDEEAGFERLASVSIGDEWYGSRGMYIGDFAYVISNSGIAVLDMQSFGVIAEV